MTVIQNAVRYPVTTAVGVILVVLFGMISLFGLPVQLTPDITQPQVSVMTIWPGASPEEVEREIIDEQEEQLKSLEGLEKMFSSSADSVGTLTLRFFVGVDIDAAVLRVSNRLDQVPSYPDDVDKPIITAQGLRPIASAYFALEPLPENGFEGEVSTLWDLADDFIKPEFERIPGVASSQIFGGREQELQVTVDPAKLAARQITLNELGAALDRENRNYSGGDFYEGKRRYIVRTVGEYQSPEDVNDIVVAVRDGVPVYLRDVGEARLGHRKAADRVFGMNGQVIVLPVMKQAGANVLEIMDELQLAVERLNAARLGPLGLQLTQVYDETVYVRSAISLVQNSLLVGAALAITVLLLFLRSGTSTLIIAVAIPISLIGTFLMMSWLGRTLNVISLAGLAFAVGMAVDNSIVVLENIYRHRQMGKSRGVAAVDGAKEVWGAVLASTLTTIAVFIPIAFIEEEAGQLFGDIAIAISCTVGLSLIVAITVIPSLSAKILHAVQPDETRRGFHNLWGATRIATGFANAIAAGVGWAIGSTVRRVAIVLVLSVSSIGGSVWLMPQTEYLPVGNTNFLFGMMLPPPGYNVDEMTDIFHSYEEELHPLWQTEPGSPEALQQPGGGIEQFFFAAVPSFGFMGVSARDPMRVRELVPPFFALNAKVPGAIIVAQQFSIFMTDVGGGRSIDVELTGPDLERLIRLGSQVFGQVMEKLPGAQARPIPGLDLGNPEVRVVTDRRRAADAGISNRELGYAVSVLVDGAKASDFRFEGKEIDLRLMAEQSFAHRTHLLEQMPIATSEGRIITLGSVAEISQTSGPVSIDHRNRERAITIQVTPAEQMPLETAMGIIQNDIIAPLQASGQMSRLEHATLSGSADKLTQTFDVLQSNFLLAIVITYLLMAALFESFLYPFVIMFSVPLAALGGFLGLAALNAFVTYQALDVLTMLGFIVLVGTTVNNAILIVHQSLNHMRDDGMDAQEAIQESTRTRIRPIFMTVMTTVCAMMPLVLFPGAGSELYRGLGSVVVGGLIVSTVFTLFLVPALFSLVLDIRAALGRRMQRVLHAPGH